MFLKSADIDFEILTVLDVDRPRCRGNSGIRPFHSLSLRMAGNAVLTHNDDTVNVQGGDMLFVPANYPYWIDAGKERLFVIHFKTNAEMPDTFRKLTVGSLENYRRDLERLCAAWSTKQTGFMHECKYLLHKIVMKLEREAAFEFKPQDGLSEAVEYIHERFCDRDLSVELLAKQCSMSDTYFRRLFKEHYQITPLKYINRLKVSYAVELLRSKYYTVSEVAEKCGFENVYYFSLFIKKETGQSPSQI